VSYTHKWYSLTDEEVARLNPPQNARAGQDWLSVGRIARPKSRLGWFIYHLVHGLWMRYPPHKVLGYALANTKPREFDCSSLGGIKLPDGEIVYPDRAQVDDRSVTMYWDVPFTVSNSRDASDSYVAISVTEEAGDAR
jgi:hypothetical protein